MNTNNNTTGTFMDIVAANYNKIKQLYITRENCNGRKFDEDFFNDAFIKCANHFGNNIIDYETVVKYFWVAYVNTCKDKNNTCIELWEEYPDILDDNDKTFAQVLYDDVMCTVMEEFSEDDMLIYSLYKYYNWTKSDLENAGYNIKNLEIRIKTIHKFVKQYAKNKYKIKSLN